MDKAKKFFKNFIYLQNILFLIFDKHEDLPKEAGKMVGKSIRESMFLLYPSGRYSDTNYRKRKEWIKEFRIGLDSAFDEEG